MSGTNRSFGSFLRELRNRAGFTQQGLADALELDFTYISKIERDKAPPPARSKIALAATVLGVSAEERDELFVFAAKMPEDLEEWMIEKPQVLKLYRTIREYPKREQGDLINKLIVEAQKGKGKRKGRED